MTNPRRIKAIAGNSASCLGFSIALFTGSIPAASRGTSTVPTMPRRWGLGGEVEVQPVAGVVHHNKSAPAGPATPRIVARTTAGEPRHPTADVVCPWRELETCLVIHRTAVLGTRPREDSMKEEDKSRSGGPLGPYHVTLRYRALGGGLGRLYEARNNETGNPALVLVPGPKGDLRAEEDWQVRAIANVTPPYLALEVERAPVNGQPRQLTWMLERWAVAFMRIDTRPEARAHLTGGPKAPRPRPAGRLGSPGGALGLAALLALAVVLWPRATVHPQEAHPQKVHSMEESLEFIRSSDEALAGIEGIPMPDKPTAGQKRPPCDAMRGEVELRGACWLELAKHPPCPRGIAEYQGKCYVGVEATPRAPTSMGP